MTKTHRRTDRGRVCEMVEQTGNDKENMTCNSSNTPHSTYNTSLKTDVSVQCGKKRLGVNEPVATTHTHNKHCVVMHTKNQHPFLKPSNCRPADGKMAAIHNKSSAHQAQRYTHNAHNPTKNIQILIFSKDTQKRKYSLNIMMTNTY